MIKRLFTKSCNTILTERLQRYQPYHQIKLMNTNILQVEKYYFSDQKRIIEKAKFDYSSVRKTFEKQTKAIQDQGDKQIVIVKESNALIKNMIMTLKKLAHQF